MKIPLAITVHDEELVIFVNKHIISTPLPIKPFALVECKEFPDIEGKKESWTKIPEHEETEYYRCTFNTRKEQIDFITRYKDRERYVFKNPYLEQVFISHEDFCFKYPFTENLKIMYFDIEVATKGDGLFPKPITNEVLCIGYSIWEFTNDGKMNKIKSKIIKGYNDTTTDYSILTEFRNDVILEDPDVIAGYNTNDFDFPYLVDRYKLQSIPLEGFGRNNQNMYIQDGEVRIPGRVHFDIYASNSGVSKDQTLFGLKSKTLKELARFYKAKLDDVEVQEHIEDLVTLFCTDPDKLYSYQDADIIRTEHVGNVYMRNCITLAEMLGVPLNNVVNMRSSFIPKLFLARNMEKLRLINSKSNFQKYNVNNGSVAKLGSKFQGALTGLYKKGFFDHVYKVDFSSMYPSSIQTWNLGPDTTTLHEVKEYTGKYKFSRDNKYNWYRIPDSNFNVDLIIKVRNDQEGFLKKEIKRLKLERKKIRSEMTNCPPEIKETLNSQQNAIKVLLNSIYGVLGEKSTIYGDMMSGMMVTAMCRWTTGKVIRKLRTDLVELDTDGLILDKPVDAKDVNEWLDKIIKEKFGFTDNYMQMESEDYGRAYFYRIKNYVIQENNKFIKHGSSLKSSRVAKVVDRATNLAIEHWFNGKPKDEVIKEAYNFKGLDLSWFEGRSKLGKEKVEYDDQTAAALLLAKQVEMKTGQICTQGTQINFVVTKNQLPFKELKPFYKKSAKWNYVFIKYVDDIKELNLTYYNELIDKALKRFDIKRNEQLSIFEEQDDSGVVLDIIPKEDDES